MTENEARDIYYELVGKYNLFMKSNCSEKEGSNYACALNREYETRTGKFSPSCFSVRFWNDWSKRKSKIERAKAKEKSQHEKLQIRLEAGDLAAEKGLAHSLLTSGQKFEKTEIEKMSYKAYWIGDCVAKAIVA